MNRSKGFINLNRFKSGRAIQKLSKSAYPRRGDKPKKVKGYIAQKVIA